MPLIGGTSYQPGTLPGAGGLRPGAEPQEAVRVLNLRLPRRPANAPVPGALLSGSGGGGGAGLDGLLRALMQAFAARGGGGGGREVVGPGGPGMSSGDDVRVGSIPQPRIRIGDTPGSERLPVDEPAPMQPGQPLFDPGRAVGASIAGTTLPNKDWQWQAGLPLF